MYDAIQAISVGRCKVSRYAPSVIQSEEAMLALENHILTCLVCQADRSML